MEGPFEFAEDVWELQGWAVQNLKIFVGVTVDQTPLLLAQLMQNTEVGCGQPSGELPQLRTGQGGDACPGGDTAGAGPLCAGAPSAASRAAQPGSAVPALAAASSGGSYGHRPTEEMSRSA